MWWILSLLLIMVAVEYAGAQDAVPLANTTHGQRIYTEQFPPGSELLGLPPVAIFSLYMGHVSYDYLTYTVASMRYNPDVDFVIVNVGDPEAGGVNPVAREAARHGVRNLILFELSIAQWRERVYKYLGIDVPFTLEWYYKMCDYKPTLATLFPEVLQKKEYAFWGYGDIDVVWGNVSRFSHLFQGQHPVIISGWFHSTGALALFKNDDTYRNMFRLGDPVFSQLLRNKTYHNLDEHGIQVEDKNVFKNGEYSVSHMVGEVKRYEEWNWNTGRAWQDHCFMDAGDSNEWAGPVVWQNGALSVVRGSDSFPPGRELLFYHRPSGRLNYRPDLRESLVEDGLKYGFVLPDWTPVMSRHACKVPHTSENHGNARHMHSYAPYHSQECYGGAVNQPTDKADLMSNAYPY